jgi:hypothetical protein
LKGDVVVSNDEKAILDLMNSDEKWKNIFEFIIHLSEENPHREKLFRDQVNSLIEYVSDLDED